MAERPRKFTLSFHPKTQTLEDRYPVSPPSRDLTVAATVLQLRSLDEAVRTALLRQGFGNTDIMAGITYPLEANEGDEISEGFVEVYMGFIDERVGESHRIHEVELLEVLKQMLVFRERYELAGQVKELQDRLRPPGN
ncbi:MAG: hypothetical protein HZB91_03385 [Elusimicrobia bacterium]|nr:hypothetical protein [Elusimicrobiota bacterium]